MREWKIGRELGPTPAGDRRPTRDAPFFRGFEAVPVSETQERYGFRFGSSRQAKDVGPCFSAGLSAGGAARAITNAGHGSAFSRKLRRPVSVLSARASALFGMKPRKDRQVGVALRASASFASGLIPRSRFWGAGPADGQGCLLSGVKLFIAEHCYDILLPKAVCSRMQ
jgi:hypothetical protein